MISRAPSRTLASLGDLHCKMHTAFSILIFAFLPVFACSGLELVHLKNGFTLEADSHSTDEARTIFRVGAGTLTFDLAEISSIEVVNEPSPAVVVKAASSSADPEKVLTDAAATYGIDPAFVRSVAQIESGLRQSAVSPKGAIGLMQLMPGTAAALQVNPTEASANASGGARYLRELLLRYKGDSVLALAAYNAGPGAVQKFQGAPPFPETRHYITAVLQEYKRQLKVKPQLKAPSGKLNGSANKPSATD